MTTWATKEEYPVEYVSILTGDHVDSQTYIITDEEGVAFLVLDDDGSPVSDTTWAIETE